MQTLKAQISPEDGEQIVRFPGWECADAGMAMSDKLLAIYASPIVGECKSWLELFSRSVASKQCVYHRRQVSFPRSLKAAEPDECISLGTPT